MPSKINNTNLYAEHNGYC